MLCHDYEIQQIQRQPFRKNSNGQKWGSAMPQKLESTLKIDQNLSTLNFGCTEEEKCLPAASGLSLTSRVSKGEIMKL